MSTNGGSPRTMFQKIWDEHVVLAEPTKQAILYIDLHLVHEVTSAQAFEGLRLAGRKVRRPELTKATPDHNVPTTDRSLPIADPISKPQIDTLDRKSVVQGKSGAPSCLAICSPGPAQRT